MPALHAPVYPGLGLIGGSCLAQYPEGLVVVALRALGLGLGHGVIGLVEDEYLPVLVALGHNALLAR